MNPFDAFIHVKPDGKISLIVAKSEMGQGIKTGLAMLLAEEAEVDFNLVTCGAGGDAPRYLCAHGYRWQRQHDGELHAAAARRSDACAS